LFSRAKPALASSLKLPFLALGLLLGVGCALLVLTHTTAGITFLVAAVVGGVVLLGCAYMLDTAVRQLSVEAGLQVGGLVPLLSLAGSQPLAPLGGSALSPAAAGRLVSIVSQERPRCVVELGAGSSTILLAQLRHELGLDQDIISIEHDEKFIDIVQEHLNANNVAERVSLRHVPLAGQTGTEWYDERVLADSLPEVIDLLIIDGPPDVRGRGTRAQALPVLRPRLGPRSIVFVDDTNRAAESRMVDEWLEVNPTLEPMLHGRDHQVMRIR
jgi:predicted O-methyltransferase YrrM